MGAASEAFVFSSHHFGFSKIAVSMFLKICYNKKTGKMHMMTCVRQLEGGSRVQKIFTRMFCGVMAVALIFMLTLGYFTQSRNAERHMLENSRLKLDQIARTLETNDAELRELTASLNEDYLTRCRAFAYILQKDPSVLRDQDALNRIKALLNVDELHVINGDGILFAGTVPKYFGMDFRTTDQTAEFLQILDHPGTVLVQEVRPNGAEKKMFQYVGVARQDAPGIVQIGLAPKRLLEAQRRMGIPYVFSHVPVDAGSVLFAVDCQTGRFLAHSNPAHSGKNLSYLGFDLSKMSGTEYYGWDAVDGEKKFYLFRRYGNLALGIGQIEAVLYADRWNEVLFMFFYMLLTTVIVILIINRLMKWHIVDGIHRIMGSLARITDGDLDTVVRVESNPEFQQLSSGINKMVQSILEATVKVTKVIEMTEMPIGVFEFRGDSPRVIATDRLRYVMGWTSREADALYDDKNLFSQALNGIIHNCPCREGGAYQICPAPERWVRIHMASDESGTFGVATDVTKDIQEKQRIEHERDYDPLTGLRNIVKFREDVAVCLNTKGLGVVAMVMLDLDHFKEINDQYGHDWGDRYLQETAGFLENMGGQRITARRSGDEFCLFLYGYTSRSGVLAAIYSLYDEIRSHPLLFPDGAEKSLEISAGIAWRGDGLWDYDSLMKAADCALYTSKQGGRGIVSEYQDECASPNSAPG